ncbi:MAG TPA: bacillithiol biosynthesis cysteine-adding enzyme BshC [Candidatus Acidoferrales bacterium]|nr:bacillithiol biosynthesis cysteine-adding enzyme BshC [Candidatus Acidoferrales bacterium]
MSADCIPFSAIPHTSRLFQHFLFDYAQVSRFYPHRPTAAEVSAYARGLATKYPAERRERIAAILERQNREFGSSAATMEAIGRLRRGAVAVISGQQVGLFGGPLYSLLKAVHAVALARELTEQGVDAVPIFWLATEDHDLAEINHTVLPHSGKLHEFVSAAAGGPDQPVGEIQLTAETQPMVAEFASLLGDDQIAEAVKASYAEGESYGSAFGKLFARLFADHGFILVNPLDAELHAIAGPLMVNALTHADDLDSALLARGKQLRDAGYHEQVKVTPSSTLLFSLQGDKRTVIHLAGENFMIGAQIVKREELLARVAARPEEFSANVLLRPVVQDWLFPTAAYLGGPAELAYFAQCNVVYVRLLGRTTPVLPRLSATIINGRTDRLLRRYRLSIPDLFHGSEHLRETLAARVLPAGLQQLFLSSFDNLDSMLHELKTDLDRLDHTLFDAAERAGRKMHYQLTRLSAKAARAELRRNQQLITDSALIETELFPKREMQERTIPGVYFLAQHGPSLIDKLIDVAGAHCPGHQLVRV